jgi:hypothetical protein
MTEDSDLGQLGAFSRNRAPASFSALDRSNTGSAKNTPKSDMDLLACIQHLASLNWASHRMAARSPTSCVPRPGARPRMLVGILLSYGLLLCRSGEGNGSNIGGSLELMIRNGARPWHSKKRPPGVDPDGHRYCSLDRKPCQLRR